MSPCAVVYVIASSHCFSPHKLHILSRGLLNDMILIVEYFEYYYLIISKCCTMRKVCVCVPMDSFMWNKINCSTNIVVLLGNKLFAVKTNVLLTWVFVRICDFYLNLSLPNYHHYHTYIFPKVVKEVT